LLGIRGAAGALAALAALFIFREGHKDGCASEVTHNERRPIMRSRKPLLLESMLLAATPILSACAKTMGLGAIEPIQGADTFCTVAKPIIWSSRDTDETIREVKKHNAVYVRLCRPPGPG
jgi:hypothetical protein